MQQARGPSVGAPPSQQRMMNGQTRPGQAQGTPQQATYSISASHPSHPQHQSWLQAQQQQQQHAGSINAGYPAVPEHETGLMQPLYNHMQHSMAPSTLPMQSPTAHHPSIRINTSFSSSIGANGPLSAGGPHSTPVLPAGAISPSPHALNARPLPSPSSGHPLGQNSGGQLAHTDPQRPGPPLHSNSYSGPMGSTTGRASPLLDPRGPPPMPSTTPQQFRQLPAQATMRPPPAPSVKPELLLGAQLVAQG